MKDYGLARRACAALTAAALVLPGIASAQEQAQATPVYLEDSGSPFGKLPTDAGEAAKVEMPKLDFTPSATDPDNYDKYYYFVRSETDFQTAYGDIVECDGYARGLASGITYTQAPYPYAGTLAGAAGGMIGSAMAMAIFGSAEKRRLRRVNMRQCMNFKGYRRYGLSKDLWQEFHFEEGLSDMPESRRFDYLKRQALVAATANPQGEELGL
ncbi:hypothetical protein ABS767_17040 [Sphingomonas sp. ST-64]|uniref:Glycine zipper domain-containing protein n=1 Tax=Sphingomonas plantiphila TaxID=3163295 RepID=A0ABW8YR56_9SPHN